MLILCCFYEVIVQIILWLLTFLQPLLKTFVTAIHANP
jgi:hypothetical protein